MGTKVGIDLDEVRDHLPIELMNKLGDDPWGVVVGYKITDGQSFGMVLELSDGSKNWFFNDELQIESIEDPSPQAIAQPKKQDFIDLSIAGSSILELLNPLYFWRWLNYSLKDVF